MNDTKDQTIIKRYELQGFPYGLKHVVAPSWLLLFSVYGVLDLVPSWSSAKCRHKYAVSSLMDTAYRMLESVFFIFLRLGSRMQRGDGVADFKRRCQDFQGDGVTNLTTALGRSRIKVALEDSTWRHDMFLALDGAVGENQ
ncbi:hypothetical protein Tco_1186095 [Tanacetum coccineum]